MNMHHISRIGAALLVWALARWLRSPGGQAWWQRTALRLPVMGKLVYNYALGADPSGIDAEESIRQGAHIVYHDWDNSSDDFHERLRCSLRDYAPQPVDAQKGDVNQDGNVDVADISSILTVMASTGTDALADVNQDGIVDVADISAVLTIMAK